MALFDVLEVKRLQVKPVAPLPVLPTAQATSRWSLWAGLVWSGLVWAGLGLAGLGWVELVAWGGVVSGVRGSWDVTPASSVLLRRLYAWLLCGHLAAAYVYALLCFVALVHWRALLLLPRGLQEQWPPWSMKHHTKTQTDTKGPEVKPTHHVLTRNGSRAPPLCK